MTKPGRIGTLINKILFSVLVVGLFASVPHQPRAETLDSYPHRVDVDYTQDALVCPIRSAGVFGWSDALAGPGSAPAPENAARAVLWQEPDPRGVMLHWEHPVHNPTTDEYTILLYAQVTIGGPGSVVQIQATPPRPASRRSDNLASGPAAQVGGERMQAAAELTFTTDSVFFRNDPVGYAVEIWATRAGSDGCSLRLATYTFHNGNTD